MGSYAYDYLNESILLDGALISTAYKEISDSELKKELLRYREYCLKILPSLRKETETGQDILSCMATNTMSQISTLKQAALYLEQAVVKDVIFELTDFQSEATKAMTSFMGVKPSSDLNRQELTTAALRMVELRPLVYGGYVKLYPISFELENEKLLPLLYSENGFEDCLPSSILKIYKDNADVRSVVNDNGRMLVMKDLYTCRNISIQFKGMERGLSMGYMLNPVSFSKTDKENVYNFIQTKAIDPPSQAVFSNWVNQSINSTALNHYIDLRKRIALCDQFNCMFSTDHLFESSLLNMAAGSVGIKENTLNCTLQMDIPFLNKVSSSDLMSIRNNDSDAFQLFRSELERGLRQARHESDPDRVRSIIEDTQHELFEVKMKQINPLFKRWKKTHLNDVGIAAAGLAFSVHSGGWSVLASISALVNSYKSHNDYKSKLLSNPCHFLWQVKNKMK